MSFSPLKLIYDQKFYNTLVDSLEQILSNFDSKKFIKLIFNEDWDHKELKERMRHTSNILNIFLAKDFKKACKQIIQITEITKLDNLKYGSLAFMFLPDYIEIHGISNFDLSMETLRKITSFTSSEFAIRPFIIQNQEKALKLMETWSLDSNYHIRRLASEGCRPKLPWALALKELQKDPNPILKILENLKNDPNDYVYRSVANNLNDISKDHPDLVLKICEKWKGENKNTDWVIKHALRTLLKKGNQKAMQIFGYGNAEDIEISDFKLSKKVKIGDYLEFSFSIFTKKKSKNRLEYGVYFLMRNNELSKKVFKISEKEYGENLVTKINRRHSFKIISTRKYYKGFHKFSIIVNGIEKVQKEFNLTE